MLFFFRSLIFRALFCSIVVFRIARSKYLSSLLKRSCYAVYALELSAYIFCLFFFKRFPLESFARVQNFNAFWVIINAYAALIFVLFGLIYFLRKKIPAFSKHAGEKFLAIAELFFLSSALVFILVGLRQGKNDYLAPRVRSVYVDFFIKDKGHRQLKYPETLKIAIISDVHLGGLINRHILHSYVEQINSLHADAVVIDGDLVDYELSYLVHQRMDLELKSIKAKYGTFFVPGNHEYKFNPDLKFKWIEESGLHLLKDTVSDLGGHLAIVGRDDLSDKKRRKSLLSLLREVPEDRAEIVFSHQPGDIEESYACKVPLTVCAHTHGGQVFPFSVLSALVQKNNYGLKKEGGCYSYTTSGIGLSGIPMRLLTHSEILVLNLRIY